MNGKYPIQKLKCRLGFKIGMGGASIEEYEYVI